jgi:hypothetical protein
MTKLVLGTQHDDSASDLSLDTDGASGLEVRGGDLHDRSRQAVRVTDRSGSAPEGQSSSSGPSDSQSIAPGVGGSRRVLAVGAFLVLALAAVAAILVGVTRLVSPLWIPVVIVASFVMLYLVAIATLPRDRIDHMAGFVDVLKDFMSYVLGKSSSPKR